MKPEIVIKGGAIAWLQMGDAKASIPTPQPVHMCPMFDSEALGVAKNKLSHILHDSQ